MIKESTTARHSTQSSYREMLVEHLFTGELLRALWLRDRRAEAMKPQVDDGGYDLVVEVDGIVRHIQLKSSKEDATTARQKVHLNLEKKPSGCVIWIYFDDCFNLGPFLWFGGRPREPLPGLSEFETAKHSKGDSTGKKAERPDHRVVPKGRFVRLDTIEAVVDHLFGHSSTL